MPDHGLTVSDIAARYRVSAERVRGWIASGQLRALNRRERGKRPSFVVLPGDLITFERSRTISPPAATPARRKKQIKLVDYYPD